MSLLTSSWTQMTSFLEVPTIFLIDSKGVVRYKQSVLPTDMEERCRQLSPN
jgi:hypothetical protein